MSALGKYLFLVVFISTLIYSCKPDEPIEPEPEDPRDKITGTWTCKETSEDFGATTFTVSLRNHSSDNSKIWIDNIYNLSTSESTRSVYAILSDMSLSIPSQTVVNDAQIITGNGSISSNYKTINFSYTANDGSGDLDHITAIFTKQ
ncbi:MAG: hypothetical protein A2033_03920 [Bacteroidetes bacterium GWA2_31_9]|nr:MAG: hypothetical protein A2033_03920 [Bacteroidetes bacterium GWA2_31_9]